MSSSNVPRHGTNIGTTTELDFFGEPTTFRRGPLKSVSNAMASYDGFLLCVVSKGRSCFGGGDEHGLETQSSHSVALAWAEALRHASVWNQRDEEKACPMMAVITVAPVLIQAGMAYVKNVDHLLKQTRPIAKGMPDIQMHEMVETAVQQKDDPVWNDRERRHLQALEHLIDCRYDQAMLCYLRILRLCPGDALALSFAMDLAQIIGDKQAALRAVGSVASYWNERRGGIITPSLPGHALVSSLMALGYAVAGRDEDAARIAETSMSQNSKICGAVATWAQTHVFDAKGRVAEGISACANFDGVANYEGAGLLFFDSRLGGYGARFSLDREERGRGKSAALRLYEANFERVLDYSGFSEAQPWTQPRQSAPLAWQEPKVLLEDNTKSSLFGSFFSKKKTEDKTKKYELMMKKINFPSTNVEGWEPSCEDTLTWLPPTPSLLSDATLLLLRFTLNGTISPKNARWDNVRNGWSALFKIQEKYNSDLAFHPLACVTASLLLPPEETGGDQQFGGSVSKGLHLMGKMLRLGNPETVEERTTSVRELIAETDPNFWLPAKEDAKGKWKEIVNLLTTAIDGAGDDVDFFSKSSRFGFWDFETRPILEHAICYSACKAGDIHSLSIARSICSNGVTLRTNAPEEWWRYSIVLGLLGDDVASEDALNNSINFGGGQGAKS